MYLQRHSEVKRPRPSRASRTRIGTAFQNQGGSWNLLHWILDVFAGETAVAGVMIRFDTRRLVREQVGARRVLQVREYDDQVPRPLGSRCRPGRSGLRAPSLRRSAR